MQMEVEDSLSGAASTIHSEVETGRLMLLIQAGFELAGDLQQGNRFFVGKFKIIL